LEREILGDLERYDRQIRIIGIQGQAELSKTSVLVAGVGGLGCVASTYLAAAGVGKIILVDKGRIEKSNLNRQILYSEKDIEKFKAQVAAEKLRKLNSEIEIEGIVAEINDKNAMELIKKVDIVIDGMDNYRGRFSLNRACIKLNKIFIHGAVHGLFGQLMVIAPNKGPCLQCVIPKEPPQIDVIPIIGVIPAIIASLEVLEAIKIITGIGEPTIGKMIFFDGETMKIHEIKVSKKDDCPICGKIGE